jgi:hypothetical protein
MESRQLKKIEGIERKLKEEEKKHTAISAS